MGVFLNYCICTHGGVLICDYNIYYLIDSVIYSITYSVIYIYLDTSAHARIKRHL